MLKRFKDTLDANIDYGGAVVGATLLGAIVFRLNYAHGMPLAATAALKQATYTFFVAGFIVKNNERLARRWTDPALSLLVAVAVSSCVAVTLTFLVHSLKGTPEPWLSTLPTALLGPPGFLILAWRARRGTTLTAACGSQAVLKGCESNIQRAGSERRGSQDPDPRVG